MRSTLDSIPYKKFSMLLYIPWVVDEDCGNEDRVKTFLNWKFSDPFSISAGDEATALGMTTGPTSKINLQIPILKHYKICLQKVQNFISLNF